MPDLLPFLPWEGVLWDGLALANVDGDVPGVHPPLELAHLGVLSPPPEQPWRLHPEVAHLCTYSDHLQRDAVSTSASDVVSQLAV